MAVSIVGILACFGMPAWSQDASGVAAAHRAYVARCTPDVSAQGVPPDKAAAVCECAGTAIEAQVKVGTAGDRERYNTLMQAEPDPNGSPDDRVLYSILAPCFAQAGPPTH